MANKYVNDNRLQQSLEAVRDRLVIKDKTEAQALTLSTTYPNCVYYTSDTHKIIVDGQVYGIGTLPSMLDKYLTFECLTAGTITMKAGSVRASKTISYSIDNGSTWIDLTTSTTAQSFGTFAIGDKVLVKGINDSYYGVDYNWNYFGGTAQVKVYGNIMSLIYGDNFIGQTSFPSGSTYNFSYLFNNYTNLIDASNLILPATTLAQGCYCNMFRGCTSLTKAPELLATTLAFNCYYAMFKDCTSLTQAPELPATTLASGCYYQMFSGCTSLTKSPELPATTLVNSCYAYMFCDCTSLNYIKCLATDISAFYCMGNWTSNVSQTGTFIKHVNVTWPIGDSGIPTGWNVEEWAELGYILDKVQENSDKLKDVIYVPESHELYLDKGNSTVLPISHPDLSTQPSVLPERFGKYTIQEVLLPIYPDETVPGNDYVVPHITEEESYLTFNCSNLIKKDAMILDAQIVGEGITDSPTLISETSNYKVYTMLPLNKYLDRIWYLLIKYSEGRKHNGYYY